AAAGWETPSSERAQSFSEGQRPSKEQRDNLKCARTHPPYPPFNWWFTTLAGPFNESTSGRVNESTSQPMCTWPGSDPLMQQYHDTEWGVPLHDDHKLFEFMVLDAFQAGLSWRTVLHKREAFRAA